MIANIVWALVALLLILLINYRYGQWQERQKPLSEKQYDDAVKLTQAKHAEVLVKIEDLQNQLSRLSMQKGFSDD